MTLKVFFTNVLDSISENFVALLTGSFVFVVIEINKFIERKSAATLIVMQINDLKDKLSKIEVMVDNKKLSEVDIYESLDILDDNQWNKYKHIFIKDLDNNSIKIINSFYEGMSIIREQILLAKQLQQQFFLNNQRMLNDDFNYFFIETYQNNLKCSNNNLLSLVNDIPTKNEYEDKLKHFAESIVKNNYSNTYSQSDLLNTYNKIKDDMLNIFNYNRIFNTYFPEQIIITIKKELNTLSHIEIIGCKGYKKLSRIGKVK